jgi:hypothetical protein
MSKPLIPANRSEKRRFCQPVIDVQSQSGYFNIRSGSILDAHFHFFR